MTKGSGRRPKDWRPVRVGDRFGSLIISSLDGHYAQVHCDDCGGIGRWPHTWLGRPRISTVCRETCPTSIASETEYSLWHLYNKLLGRSNAAWTKTPTAVSITFKQFVELRAGARCHYCDEHLDGKGVFTRPSFIGLDRINVRRGYHLDNVLPACAMCNTARGAFLSVEEFKAAIAVRLAKLLPGQAVWADYERKVVRED